MSSLGSAIIAMSWPSGAACPSLTMILRKTPLESACISIVALSVSISASGSPMETLSPSFFNQREICPSSIVGESFGMITLVAIICLICGKGLTQIRDFAHSSDDTIDIRYRKILEVLRVRHRHVRARNALHRRIEIIKRTLHDLRADLRAHAADRMRLFGNHDAVRLLH